MKLRTIAFSAVVALVVVGAVAFAQQSRDGSTTPTGGISFWPFGGTDGTYNRALRTDAQGILRVTEEYPNQFQTSAAPLMASVACANKTQVNSSTYDACSIYGRKWLRIQVATVIRDTTTIDKGQGPLVIRPEGSNDGVNFYPIMRVFHVQAAVLDSTFCDTLQYNLWSSNNSSLNAWYPLYDTQSGQPFPWRYLRIGVINRCAYSQTVSLEVAGRQD